MSTQGFQKNENNEDMQSLMQMEQYFDFHSVRLRSFSNSNIQNLFLSLHSMGRRQSNRIDLLAPINPQEGEDFRANHTREDLEIESGIILKRYGKVLKIFLRENSNICFLCKLHQELQTVSAEYQIIQTNLLRKYYPISVKKITRKIQKLCKIMFYDLNKAIYKARNKDQFSQREVGLDETPTEDFYSKRIAPLSKSEIYNFRKFLVDWEEIKFDEAKEYLFGYHTQKDYWSLFSTYYRINQFNLIRPKLHVNEVTKIQKTKYDLMWKLRQKILRHLVSQKNESFVLKINVSKLCEYKPERSHIKERVGEYMQRGLSNEILENIQQQSLLSMQPIAPFTPTKETDASPQLRLENLINNSILFQSNKERLSYQNSFFSNMMSLRENDSMGMLGFGQDTSLSRRETSNRKDSYQLNKFGENRQSLDLFSIKKKIHEIRSEKNLLSEMKKQISIGNFEKKKKVENLEPLDFLALEEGKEEHINIYQPGSLDLKELERFSSSQEQINQNHIKAIQLDQKGTERKSNKVYEVQFLDNKTRKTFKEGMKKMPVIGNFFQKNKIQGEQNKNYQVSPEKEKNSLSDSLKELKQITSKQKQNPLPKLKDKLRNSKKTKKKIIKGMQFENKEIRREMKKFELDTEGSGHKMIYESKSKSHKISKNETKKIKSGLPKEKFLKSFKKNIKRKRNSKKNNKFSPNKNLIKKEDEQEFQKKMEKQLILPNKINDHSFPKQTEEFQSSLKLINKNFQQEKENSKSPLKQKDKQGNISRSSSDNLLVANLISSSGNKSHPKASGSKKLSRSGSKEIYTFGQVAEQEETPKDYDFHSPKLRPKKKRPNNVQTNNFKHFNIVVNHELGQHITTENSQKNGLKTNKGQLTITTQKNNVFADSFKSNPMSKGQNSQREISVNTPLGSPHGLYAVGLEDTFGDQNMPKDLSQNLKRSTGVEGLIKVVGEKPLTESQKLKKSGNKIDGGFGRKSGFKQGFLSQRDVINKGVNSLKNKKLFANKHLNVNIQISNEPKINMDNISSFKKKQNPKKTKFNTNSNSNSSEIMKNMAPAWNNDLPMSHVNEAVNTYQFKKNISPRHNFMKKTQDYDKFYKIRQHKQGMNIFSKGKIRKFNNNDFTNKMRKNFGKGSFSKNKRFSNKPIAKKGPFAKIPIKGFRGSKRGNSTQKNFKNKTKSGISISKKEKRTQDSNFGSKKSNQNSTLKTIVKKLKPENNKFESYNTQNNFMKKRISSKGKQNTESNISLQNPKTVKKKRFKNFEISKVKTDRGLVKNEVLKIKSKEINNNVFDSESENQKYFKSSRGTFKKTTNNKIPKSLKKIPLKNPKKQSMSSTKQTKFKKKSFFTYSNDKKISSSLYPNKKNNKQKKFGIKSSKFYQTKPSIGSIKSLKNHSPMAKGSSYFMNSLTFKDSSNSKINQPKTIKFNKKIGRTKGKLKKVKKKINAQREYFDMQTNSFKTNSIAMSTSNKSASIKKKIPKNRSRSNILQKVSKLKKNYSKKNIKKPLLKRKPIVSKNLSIGTKLYSNSKYNISQSREKRSHYGLGKYFSRGSSLTSPFPRVSKKNSSQKGSLISNHRSPSINNSLSKRDMQRIPKDKSKVSSRAAATSRYTSKEKNHIPKNLEKVTPKLSSEVKANTRSTKQGKRGLRMSYMKMEAGEKKKRNVNRNKFVSYAELFKVAYQ